MATKSVKITEKNTSVRDEAESRPLAPSATKTLRPYRSELDEFLFHEGTARHAYGYLGAHAVVGEDGVEWVIFRVWAPHAKGVSVVGSLSDWEQGIPMTRVTANGIFMLSLEGDRVPDGTVYKYRITAADDGVYLRADPYGRAMECPPKTATRFLREKPFVWHDGGWLKQRRSRAAEGRKYPIENLCG